MDDDQGAGKTRSVIFRSNLWCEAPCRALWPEMFTSSIMPWLYFQQLHELWPPSSDLATYQPRARWVVRMTKRSAFAPSRGTWCGQELPKGRGHVPPAHDCYLLNCCVLLPGSPVRREHPRLRGTDGSTRSVRGLPPQTACGHQSHGGRWSACAGSLRNGTYKRPPSGYRRHRGVAEPTPFCGCRRLSPAEATLSDIRLRSDNRRAAPGQPGEPAIPVRRCLGAGVRGLLQLEHSSC